MTERRIKFKNPTVHNKEGLRQVIGSAVNTMLALPVIRVPEFKFLVLIQLHTLEGDGMVQVFGSLPFMLIKK